MRAAVRLAVWMLLAGAVPAAPQEPALVDRTLAIVGGQAVTLSDARTAMRLGLVDAGSVAAAAEALVVRTLILREVQRYAPPDPSEAVVEQRLAGVAARTGAEPLDAVLAQGGFTEARLRAWIRDDLRIAAYLDQRFAAPGAPTREEMGVYYSARRDEFDRRGLTFDAASAEIRDRLTAERRARLIDDWVADLRRRTTVVELWRPPAGP